jgi:hypothetical protein
MDVAQALLVAVVGLIVGGAVAALAWLFGIGRRRHPLVTAWRTAHGRFRRRSYARFDAAFTALMQAQLRVPRDEARAADETPRDAADEAAAIALETPEGLAAVACLDERAVRRHFPDATASFVKTGAEICAWARKQRCVGILVVGDTRHRAEFGVAWQIFQWLGAGLRPSLFRLAGSRQVLHVPGLVNACRAAVVGRSGLLGAELYQGVGYDGTGWPIVVVDLEAGVVDEQWFTMRDSMETAIRSAGHTVAVVSAPEEMVQEDQDSPSLIFAERSVYLV